MAYPRHPDHRAHASPEGAAGLTSASPGLGGLAAGLGHLQRRKGLQARQWRLQQQEEVEKQNDWHLKAADIRGLNATWTTHSHAHNPTTPIHNNRTQATIDSTRHTSAQVGWMPTRLSKSFLVALRRMAMAKPCTISPAFGPAMWMPTTRIWTTLSAAVQRGCSTCLLMHTDEGKKNQETHDSIPRPHKRLTFSLLRHTSLAKQLSLRCGTVYSSGVKDVRNTCSRGFAQATQKQCEHLSQHLFQSHHQRKCHNQPRHRAHATINHGKGCVVALACPARPPSRSSSSTHLHILLAKPVVGLLLGHAAAAVLQRREDGGRHVVVVAQLSAAAKQPGRQQLTSL